MHEALFVDPPMARCVSFQNDFHTGGILSKTPLVCTFLCWCDECLLVGTRLPFNPRNSDDDCSFELVTRSLKSGELFIHSLSACGRCRSSVHPAFALEGARSSGEGEAGTFWGRRSSKAFQCGFLFPFPTYDHMAARISDISCI